MWSFFCLQSFILHSTFSSSSFHPSTTQSLLYFCPHPPHTLAKAVHTHTGKQTILTTFICLTFHEPQGCTQSHPCHCLPPCYASPTPNSAHPHHKSSVIKSWVPSVQWNPTLAVRQRRDAVSDAVRRARVAVVEALVWGPLQQTACIAVSCCSVPPPAGHVWYYSAVEVLVDDARNSQYMIKGCNRSHKNAKLNVNSSLCWKETSVQRKPGCN